MKKGHDVYVLCALRRTNRRIDGDRMSLNITCISDTHGMHNNVELCGGDILIHAGDIEATDAVSLYNFLQWFDSQEYLFKVFIAGNHDWFLYNYPDESRDIISNFNVVYLKDSCFYAGDIKIHGTPWSEQFFNWAFMKDLGELERHYNKTVESDNDIIVSHAPVRGFGGKTSNGVEAGVIGLPESKYVVCGHIHEGYGVYEDKYINCSLLNERYEMVNKPIQLIIEDE